MKILIDIQEETYNKMRRGEALYPADANVAIFAIETGTPLEECDDCISRRAVLERAINAPIAKVVTEDKVIYRKIIFADDVEKLPPVTPAEKVGHWTNPTTMQCMKEQIFYYCSVCGNYADANKYCPNCGAKMQEVKNNEIDN